MFFATVDASAWFCIAFGLACLVGCILGALCKDANDEINKEMEGKE
jgi:hypothetical protein